MPPVSTRRIDSPRHEVTTWTRSSMTDGDALHEHLAAKAGGTLRTRLQGLGFLRASGHEHFTGSLVVPILDAERDVSEVYGRKVAEQGLRAGTPRHLYLPYVDLHGHHS